MHQEGEHRSQEIADNEAISFKTRGNLKDGCVMFIQNKCNDLSAPSSQLYVVGGHASFSLILATICGRRACFPLVSFKSCLNEQSS